MTDLKMDLEVMSLIVVITGMILRVVIEVGRGWFGGDEGGHEGWDESEGLDEGWRLGWQCGWYGEGFVERF